MSQQSPPTSESTLQPSSPIPPQLEQTESLQIPATSSSLPTPQAVDLISSESIPASPVPTPKTDQQGGLKVVKPSRKRPPVPIYITALQENMTQLQKSLTDMRAEKVARRAEKASSTKQVKFPVDASGEAPAQNDDEELPHATQAMDEPLSAVSDSEEEEDDDDEESDDGESESTSEDDSDGSLAALYSSEEDEADSPLSRPESPHPFPGNPFARKFARRIN